MDDTSDRKNCWEEQMGFNAQACLWLEEWTVQP